jgi:hypothetical protein
MNHEHNWNAQVALYFAALIFGGGLANPVQKELRMRTQSIVLFACLPLLGAFVMAGQLSALAQSSLPDAYIEADCSMHSVQA